MLMFMIHRRKTFFLKIVQHLDNQWKEEMEKIPKHLMSFF